MQILWVCMRGAQAASTLETCKHCKLKRTEVGGDNCMMQLYNCITDNYKNVNKIVKNFCVVLQLFRSSALQGGDIKFYSNKIVFKLYNYYIIRPQKYLNWRNSSLIRVKSSFLSSKLEISPCLFLLGKSC